MPTTIPTPSELSPFSKFPVELVCDILKIAASSSRESAHTLLFVSKAVNRIVKPYIFKTVVIRSPQKLEAFNRSATRYIRSSLPIQNLWIRDSNVEFPPNLAIKLTHSVERLAITERGFQQLLIGMKRCMTSREQQESRQTRSMQLTITHGRLSHGVSLGRNLGDPSKAARHIFGHITHLQLHARAIYDEPLINFNVYTKLTHLALPCIALSNIPMIRVPTDSEIRSIQQSRQLRMIVLLVHAPCQQSDLERVKELRRTDRRIHLAVVWGSYGEQEWLREAEGTTEGIWERAVADTADLFLAGKSNTVVDVEAGLGLLGPVTHKELEECQDH